MRLGGRQTGSVGLEATELAALIRRRELSVVEVIEEHLRYIERVDAPINGFCEVLFDEALSEARRLEDLRAGGAWGGPLFGVPLAVKDHIETVAGHTTWGSPAFAGERAGFDAAIVQHLLEAGCVLIGKSNMPELAMSAHTDNPLYGPTLNPWDYTRTPGGSSGGAAAIVTTGMVPISLGSDSGGSIRVPASCCHVLGLKPSRGRVSFAPSAQEMWAGVGSYGPIAFSVKDLALMFDIMSIPAGTDPYRAPPMVVSASEAVRRKLPPLRIAVSTEGQDAPVDPEVATAVLRVADLFAKKGHQVSEAAPDVRSLRDSVLVMDLSLFAAQEFPQEKKQLLGAYSAAMTAAGERYSAVEYNRALAHLERQSMSIIRFWEEYDVFLSPTMSILPPLAGHSDEPLERLKEHWDWAQFVFPFNLTGQPALSVPAALSSAGLPIGAQLVSALGREDILFGLASDYEFSEPWDHAPVTTDA